MRNKVMPLIAAMLLFISASAQTNNPVYLSQAIAGNSCKGYYEYLPADYATSTKNYPIIIWVHGLGQIGTGSASDLPKVLLYGLPQYIVQGVFPPSFTVGGNNYSFIVISPQFTSSPTGSMVDGVVSYMLGHYRVDPDRVYLIGMSVGGGAVEDYASLSIANSNRLAGISPMGGSMVPTQAKANIIAASQLPVWLFHNSYDNTIPVTNSRNWYNYISSYIPTPNPLPLLTEFPVVSSDPVVNHDCWTTACNPTYKPNGLSVYEWLLQYKRRIPTVNATPQANAGADLGAVVPNNITLDGTGSNDPDGVIVSYRWRKINGPASYNFVDSTLASAVVKNLTMGQYGFELTVTDNLGGTSKDSVIAYVYPSLPAGPQQRVLIDVGPTTSGGGILSGTPDINGNYWNNMTDGRAGVRISNAITTTNTATTIGVEVINRIDGTYSVSGNGLNAVNTTLTVGDYLPSATKDYAFAYTGTTNGRWRIKGLDPAKVTAIKFWGTKTGETSGRDIEIKVSDETFWKTYSAAGNTNFNNAAVFNITGKTDVDFDIRAKTGSLFGYINVIDIIYNTTTPLNQPPVARAGNDTIVQLPKDSIILSGCSSSDPENKPLKYKWTKISGPACNLSTADTLCNFKITAMAAGTYSFGLTVTDDSLAVSRDTVAVFVNQPPTANAGNDISITLPVASVNLSGALSSDPEGPIAQYSWKKISGPAGATIATANAVSTDISFSTAGQYSFELTVTDNNSGVGKDTVIVNVNPDPNQPPVANAGPDVSIQLPVNSVFLDGRSSFSPNPTGSIVSFSWSVISGPSGSQLLTASKDTSTITFTNAGNYTIRLQVTDNASQSNTDDVIVTVLPLAVSGKMIRVNIYDGVISYNNPQWNNWNPVSGVNSNTLLYEDASSSTVKANLSLNPRFSDNGPNYATTATACPPAVLRINSISTIPRTLTFTGLNPAILYGFEFYASRAFAGNSTILNIGSKADTISTDFNINDIGKFSNISPDNTGKVVVSMQNIGTYQYLAGFTIIEQTGSTGRFSNTNTEKGTATPPISKNTPVLNSDNLIVYPNPFSNSIHVEMIQKGQYDLNITDISGKIVLRRTLFSDGKMAYQDIDTKQLQRGLYILQVKNNLASSVLKLIKL